MFEVDLLEFLNNATLGKITIGSSKHDVQEAFGTPVQLERWHPGHGIQPNAWIYSELFLGFRDENETVCVIGFCPRDSKTTGFGVGDQARLQARGIQFGMPIDQVDSILSELDAPSAEGSRWEHGFLVKYPSGTTMIFQSSDGSKPPTLVEINCERLFAQN
ncbi:MAG: hypothetical protein JRC77_00955 [Deltaproteobacteria bacterium]|nr:hypothetical protein [Deltaproteobacteria bacterium]